MSMALKNRLDDAVGVDLPATLTFEFPTGRALAEYLYQALPDVAADTHTAGDGLDELSDEQLLDRLFAGLAGSELVLREED
jgi:hypothetical protein